MTGDSRPIRRLDESIVRRIAAGEVVERPASAVKELVENSLDADASRVSVAVKGGGIDAIRVRDDGVGIPPDQLPEAVAEHATSKLADDDLQRVGTLGFRGEALHAIGAVSRLRVRSKPRGGESGAEITVEGGDVGGVQPAGVPEGTVVEVTDLFFNAPARRKFLAAETTEFARINGVVTSYALANPDVAVSLEHDGRETFSTPGDGDLRSAVLSVYGREVAESMIEVDADPDGPVGRIHGLVSHPETNRASRKYISTYVNGRYVTVTSLRRAVLDAYGDQLAADRHPFVVLFLELPPESVDANVHPRKLEVRFDDSAAVESAVREAVSSALLESGLLRSSAPRGRSGPEEAAVDPGSGEPTPEDAATGSVGSRAGAVDSPTDAGEAPVTGEGSGDQSADGPGSSSEPADQSPSDPWVVDDLGGPIADEPDAVSESGPAFRGAADDDSIGGDRESEPEPGPAAHDEASAAGPPIETDSQRTLDGEPTATDREFGSLPSLRILGQAFDTYLVAESEDGLVLVDQHAADERVNYERLRAAFSEGPSMQALAEPIELELTAREAAAFGPDAVGALEQFGFDAEPLEDRRVRVRGIPAVFGETLDPELLSDVLSSFVDGHGGGGEVITDAIDEILADLACYPSVTGNTSLTEGSALELLTALDECENPYACPHGRPTVISIDRDEIDDRFERDYPGHGRRQQ